MFCVIKIISYVLFLLCAFLFAMYILKSTTYANILKTLKLRNFEKSLKLNTQVSLILTQDKSYQKAQG